MILAPEDALAVANADTGIPCAVEDCPNMAAVAIWFKGQQGHTHVCMPCASYDREHYDVVGTHPLPCPVRHDRTWTDIPPPLT